MQLYETACIFSIKVFLKFINIDIPTKALITISKKVAKPPIADDILTDTTTSKNR
jgi:hypothetical protein